MASPPNYITTSPNMGLQIPAAGLTPGPEWFTAIVQSLNIIDQHNHTLGEGVQLNSGSFLLTAALPLNGNALTQVQAVTFTPGVFTTLDSLYVNGADLYYNDGNGNTIQITSGGTVNATSSGISSGTATASFVASVLVVNQATNTPASIQAGNILVGNTGVANSEYVTLKPVNALAVNYSLTLPTLPATPSLLQIDTSGNITAATPTLNPSFTTVTIGSADLSYATFPVGQLRVNAAIQPGGSAVGVLEQFINSTNTLGVADSGGTDSFPLVVSPSPTTNGLMIVRGYVSSAGAVFGGEGFSVSHLATGEYKINFSAAFLDNPVVVANCTTDNGTAGWTAKTSIVDTSHSIIETFAFSGTQNDANFMFMAIGQLA